MRRYFLTAITFACALHTASAFAVELPNPSPVPALDQPAEGEPYSERVRKMLDEALDLVGIRYRRGGNDADSGFDCSGFVGYVYRQTLGLVLPRTARDISREGEPVAKGDLKPGDLVFFNTLRHAFSHVGIYLGDNRFVHAPRAGKSVRVEDLTDRYWVRRYNGARRLAPSRI